jgi:hypothetical protein
MPGRKVDDNRLDREKEQKMTIVIRIREGTQFHLPGVPASARTHVPSLARR